MVALSLGSEDFANDIGAQPTQDVMKTPKLLVHYAAKAERLLSLGLFGSISDYNDKNVLKNLVQQAKQHGFDGATCVHPIAIPILNSGFGPSEEEVAWARRIIAAAKNSPNGAFELDGKMIDAPIVSRARDGLSRSRNSD